MSWSNASPANTLPADPAGVPPPRITIAPTGLGTSALRLVPPIPSRSNEDPSFPDLYCPPAVRDDEALGEEVNDRLVAWAEEVGIYAGHLDYFRDAQFGRMLMLTHPDTDDPDQLLLASRWMAAMFALDDYYVDEEQVGAVLEKVGPRLALAVSALDRPHLLGNYAAQLNQVLQSDPVLVALGSALGYVADRATPSQLARIRHETLGLFAGMNAETAWRYTGELPAVWEFLALRQHNSFLPCMALIDVVGSYPLPADLYSDARVRLAAGLAASSTVVVNDLYSMDKEDASESGDFNLPVLVAAEEGCSLEDAVEISVSIHNELVRAFEATHQSLMVVPSPELQRFLLGLRNWIGGNREWHSSSSRYTADASRASQVS